MRDYFSFKAKELLGKKSVKRGDIILSSEPFAYVIDAQQCGNYCDNCLTPSRLKILRPCKTCSSVWYCSDHCAFEGSEIHWHECRYLKRKGAPTSFIRLLHRLINRLKNGGDKYVEYYCANKSRKFKDLMNHYRDIRNDKKRMKEVEHSRKILVSMMGENNVPPDSDFIGLFGRALVNRFCLMDENMNPIGTGIYLAASIFDHSCVPNAYASFDGKRVVIRSLVDWQALDLTQVFISYVDPLNSTYFRRAELHANWYFWCQCSLCQDKNKTQYENCVKCENPDCRLPVPVPDKPESLFAHSFEPDPECDFCGWPVDEDRLEEYHSAVAFTRQRLRGVKEINPSVELCLNVIEKQGDIFSSIDIWKVKALDYTFTATFCNGMFASALNFGKSNLEAMKIYYGQDNPTYGMFLMKLGKTLMYLKEYREGLVHLKEAERILTIALGTKHRLVADEIQSLKLMANEDLDIYLEYRLAKSDQSRSKHTIEYKYSGSNEKKLVPLKTKQYSMKTGLSRGSNNLLYNSQWPTLRKYNLVVN